MNEICYKDSEMINTNAYYGNLRNININGQNVFGNSVLTDGGKTW